MSNSLVSYYPGNSFIHKLDPRAKILFLVVVTTVVFGTENLMITTGILAIMVALWFSAKLPWSVLWGFLKSLFPIMIFLFVVQSILYPGEIKLIYPLIPRFVPLIGGIGSVTLEGVLFSVLLAIRITAMVISLPLISFTTPVQNLALGLAKLGLPYKLAYTTTTAMNLVPILQTETGVIVDAQRLRAMQTFEKGSLGDKLKSYPALVTPLVIGAMRRAQRMAVAMDSRAFGASKERTYLEDVSMHTADWIFIAGNILVTVAVFVLNGIL